jgi:putative heme-binding domain-containing protein
MESEDLRVDAIRGFALMENAAAPAILLGRIGTFKPSERRAVVETLASRKSYALALLDAIKVGDVPKSDLPAHVVRSLRDLLGDAFTQVYGPVKELGQERQKQFSKYTRLLTDKRLEEANPVRGRMVFAKTCAACHRLYGEGGSVGPDLTGSNRANLDYLLLNSIDPSFDVPEAYRTTQVLTVDGRAVNGVLAEEDNNRIVLKTPEQPRVVIAKADIEVRKISPQSMMPEGQLEQLKEQEVVDLVRYLQTTERVELTK